MIKAKCDGFEIRSDEMHLCIGIVATLMEVFGLYFFIPMLFEPISSPIDLFGVIFLVFWLSLVLFGAISSFYRYSKKLVIDNSGICLNSFFSKRYYSWSEIKDYGVSYDGHNRDGSNNYIVYFSTDEQKFKSEYKKKLSKGTLKVHILSKDYYYFRRKVIPFCRKKTEVIPFVAVDEFHFL